MCKRYCIRMDSHPHQITDNQLGYDGAESDEGGDEGGSHDIGRFFNDTDDVAGAAATARKHPVRQVLESQIEDSSSQLPLNKRPRAVEETQAHQGTQLHKSQALPNGTILVEFAWKTSTPSTAWDFLSNHNHGKQHKRGMTFFLRHAMQLFVQPATTISDELRGFFTALLTPGQPKMFVKPDTNIILRQKFLAAAHECVWEDFTDRMHLYCVANPVFRHKAQPTEEAAGPNKLPQHLLPSHGDINALARVVVLLSFPEAQPVWNRIANESRSREAVDNPAANLVAVNEEMEMQLLNSYLNSATFTAQHSVSLAPYNVPVNVDPSIVPDPPKSLVWLRASRQMIKRIAAACSSGFVKKTGNGHGGADGADQDTQFWNFCHRDTLVMFMWLHWDRGSNVPAHCTALLADDCSFDIGARHSAPLPAAPSTPRSGGKGNASEARILDAIDRNATFTDRLLSYLATSPVASSSISSQGRTPDASAEELARASKMTALSQQLRALHDAKMLLPEDLQVEAAAQIREVSALLMAVRGNREQTH